ncbi:MAG: hypothetical protein ACJ798_10785 [Phenylobacterium sp.]
MTASKLAPGAPRGLAPAGPFPKDHPWDRNFFLAWVGLIWLGIGLGFGPELVQHVAKHEKPFEPIVHVHGAFFVGWLVLLTAQVLLVRSQRIATHRRLGLAMVGWGAAMLVLGPAVAWVRQRHEFGTPLSDPGFFSIQLIDILSFAVLGGAGVLLRRHASAHKRLMLIATLCIADAGYARFIGPLLEKAYGKAFWPDYVGVFGVTGLLIVGIGVYDLITRRRLHPAYLAGAAWGLAGQAVAVFLWFNPAWLAFTTRLFHP